MTLRRSIPLAILCFALGASLAAPQGSPDPGAPRQPGKPPGDKFLGKKKPRKPDKTRSVSGIVRDQRGEPVSGAVVKLKDTKTLQIRSFITLDDGSYRFHGLSTETDYELQASRDGMVSKKRRLSVYDSRKKAIINLKLEPTDKKKKKAG